MNKKFFKVVMVLGILALVSAPLAFAGYGKKKEAAPTAAPEAAAPAVPAAADTAAKAQGGMSEEEMMAKWKEYSTPNENHKALEPLVGNWDYTMKMWEKPDAPAQETSGTAETKWIMDGRFLEETSDGTMMGQPFHGRQVLGFDNAKKEYVSSWIDSMGTGMMNSSGTFDPATKTLTQSGSFECPFRGHLNMRWITKIIDNDTHTFEGYMDDGSGKEFKHMEIVYKKKGTEAATPAASAPTQAQ